MNLLSFWSRHSVGGPYFSLRYHTCVCVGVKCQKWWLDLTHSLKIFSLFFSSFFSLPLSPFLFLSWGQSGMTFVIDIAKGFTRRIGENTFCEKQSSSPKKVVSDVAGESNSCRRLRFCLLCSLSLPLFLIVFVFMVLSCSFLCRFSLTQNVTKLCF